MAVKTRKESTYPVMLQNGAKIELPPWADILNIDFPATPHIADSVQQYALGARLKIGLRTLFYCRANGTVSTEWGAYKAKKTNVNTVAPTQATATAQAIAFPGQTLAAGAAGSFYVTVTIDTEIGALTTGVLAENELSGGFIVIGNGTSQHPQVFQIVSHPALTTAGGALTLKLDFPLATAVTAATTNIELMESPFYNLKADGAGGDYVTFFGIPMANATPGQCFWLLTDGPTWITSDGNTCDSVGDRTLVWKGNGSIVSSNDITVESGIQIAGFAIDMSGSSASNAPFVYLQGMH